MPSGDPFPTREDLDGAAGTLESVAARLSGLVRSFLQADRRKQARAVLKQAWFATEALRAAAPGGTEGRLAMRRARDVELALLPLVGDDPHGALAEDLAAAPRRPPPPGPAPPRDPLRLPWPIRYDLDRIERLGAPARAAAATGARLDAAAAAIEARARAAMGLAPTGEARQVEPAVDMATAELARGRVRGPRRPDRRG